MISVVCQKQPTLSFFVHNVVLTNQNQWPRMTLNGRNTLLQKKMFYGGHQKNLNKDRPILSATKCRPGHWRLQESNVVAEKLHDAIVKFDNLQRHCMVLPAITRLSCYYYYYCYTALHLFSVLLSTFLDEGSQNENLIIAATANFLQAIWLLSVFLFWIALFSCIVYIAVFVFSIWKQASVFFSSCYKMCHSQRAK